MTKHYLIFSGGRGGHSVVFLLRAPTVLAAIQRFLQERSGGLTFQPDGSVEMQYGRKPILYPHTLAHVEANYKVFAEWQIRELPESVWEMDWTEDIFCGENAHDIECHLDLCRPLLRRDFPRSRAAAFVWYLKQGALVTFYRKSGHFRIEILRRYLSAREGVSEWAGSYDDLLDQLWVLRSDWEAQASHRSAV